MAHYAFLNEHNEVVKVIVGKDETEATPEGFTSWEEYYETKNLGLTCKRTSYNTYNNQHTEEGGVAFRGNFASKGYTYDESLDAFIPPKIHNGWVLNETIMNWEAPIPFPSDANADGSDTTAPRKVYIWEDSISNWVLIREDTYNTETEEWETGS